MELQGVKILRISDLRRFFDLADFWQQRNDFGKIVGDPSNTVFFDDVRERSIYLLLREWIVNDAELPLIKNDNTIVIRIDSNDTALHLGRLAPEVSKFRGCMRNKDLVGLTLLYMLVGANREDSDIPLQYDIFAALKTGNYVGDLIPSYGNLSLDPVSFPVYPLSRHVIANMSNITIIEVSTGLKSLKLNPGDCAIGIFDSNNLCYKLFDNKIEDTNYGISLCLRFNYITKKTYLKLDSKYNGTKNVEEVCSFALEKGGLPVYLTMDGKLHYSKACFALHTKFETFKLHHPEEDLLAFELDSSNNYSFYTSNKKLY